MPPGAFHGKEKRPVAYATGRQTFMRDSASKEAWSLVSPDQGCGSLHLDVVHSDGTK